MNLREKLDGNNQQQVTINGGNMPAFAQLLDKFEPEVVRRGQYVSGEILQIRHNVIFANVEAKRTAVVPPQELAQIDEEQLAELSEGDEVMLYVMHTPEGGEDLLVSLQKGLQYHDWIKAKSYLENDEILALKVVGHNKGGVLVEFGHLHGFIPNSHMPQFRHIHNQQKLLAHKSRLVGKELPLKMIEVDKKQKRLVLSAKEAMKEARQERLAALKLREGEVVTGVVRKLVKFGAFVDLGGVDGLVHISEIAWQAVDAPSDFLEIGEEIEVLILKVDVEKERIRLSHKALLPNPWTLFADEYDVGDLTTGVVTNVLDFGAFVNVTENVEGLIHVSEMYGTQDAEPQEVLAVGDTVFVRIINLEPERERMGLSQRRVSATEEIAWIWEQSKSDESMAKALSVEV